MPLHPIDQFLVPLYSDILSFPYLLLTLTIIPAVLSAVIIIFSKRYDYRNFLTLFVVFLLIIVSIFITYYIYLYSSYPEIISELPKNVIEGLTLFGFVGILLAFARDYVSEMNLSSELSSLNEKIDLILSSVDLPNANGVKERIESIKTTLTEQNGDARKEGGEVNKWTFFNFLTISGLFIAVIGSIGNLLYVGLSNPLDNYRFTYQVGLTVLIFGITWGIFKIQNVQSKALNVRLINIESRLTDLEKLVAKPQNKSMLEKIISALLPWRR